MTKTNPQVRASEQSLTPDLRERLNELSRELDAAYNAAHTPRFTVWHGLGLGLTLLLLAAQQYAPGLVADLGRIELAGAEAAILARVTTILLCMVALFGVRSMHPLTGVGLWLSVLGLSSRLGEVRVMEEPLTLAYALILAGICTVAARVIIRPNETDQIKTLRIELARLEAQALACREECHVHHR